MLERAFERRHAVCQYTHYRNRTKDRLLHFLPSTGFILYAVFLYFRVISVISLIVQTVSEKGSKREACCTERSRTQKRHPNKTQSVFFSLSVRRTLFILPRLEPALVICYPRHLTVDVWRGVLKELVLKFCNHKMQPTLEIS